MEKFVDRNLGDLGTACRDGSVGKGESRNTNMNGDEKSDSAVVPVKQANKVVPVKQANKEDKTSAEFVEERALAKGNTPQPITDRTQSRESVSAGLEGVRKAARMHKQEKFTALLHHVNVDQLRTSYFALKRQAAPGVDGITWCQYGESLLVILLLFVMRTTQRSDSSTYGMRIVLNQTWINVWQSLG